MASTMELPDDMTYTEGLDYELGYDYLDEYYYGGFDDPIQHVISNNLSRYCSPVLLLMALIGNSIALTVMSKFGFSTLSTCLYLAILALVDLLLLLHRVGNVWAKSLWDKDMTQLILIQSDVSCQVYSFLSNLLMHLCSWTLVMLILEVTLILSNPRRAHLICAKERVKNLSLLVILLLVCVNAHFFWTYQVLRPYPTAPNIICTFSEAGGFYSKTFRSLVWPIMDNLFAAILPNCIILSCLLFIAFKGYLKNEKLQELMENHFVIDAASLRSFIRVTIVLGSANIILTFPETAFNLFEFVRERMVSEHTGDSETFYANLNLACLLCYTIRDFFLCSKIFLYIIMWRSFREKTVDLLTLRNCRSLLRKKRTMRRAYVKAAYRDNESASIISRENATPQRVRKGARSTQIHINQVDSEPVASVEGQRKAIDSDQTCCITNACTNT